MVRCMIDQPVFLQEGAQGPKLILLLCGQGLQHRRFLTVMLAQHLRLALELFDFIDTPFLFVHHFRLPHRGEEMAHFLFLLCFCIAKNARQAFLPAGRNYTENV